MHNIFISAYPVDARERMGTRGMRPEKRAGGRLRKICIVDTVGGDAGEEDPGRCGPRYVYLTVENFRDREELW